MVNDILREGAKELLVNKGITSEIKVLPPAVNFSNISEVLIITDDIKRIDK